jgi:hypothetical protein
VSTDPSGGRSGPPADKIYLGGDAIVSMTLSRFDMAVFLQLLARPNPFGGVRGKNAPGERGSLIVTERLTFPLWCRWSTASKTAFSGIPAGLRLPYAELESPDGYDMGLAAQLEPTLTFYGYSVRQSDASYLCYDNDMTAVAGLQAG